MANKYVQKIEFQAKIKDLERQIKKSEKSLGGLKASALAVGAALGSMSALAMKSVNAFAEFEGVNRGFKELSRNAGFSSQALGKLQKATDNTVDSITLMKQANNALLLGIVENEDELANLMDTAQRLGRALGQDTAQAVESLTTGMGRQSKLMLDNLGIIVDTEKAYQNFAIAQGTTVSLLTDEQKKRAFNIETMRTAEEMIKGLGDEEMLTTKDSLNQMSNAFTQLSISVGEKFAPALSAVAGLMTSMTETDLSDELMQEEMRFRSIVNVIKDSNTSTESRSMAIDTLKQEYAGYLSGLQTEEEILTNINLISRNYIKHTEDRIRQAIFQEELDEAVTKRMELQRGLFQDEIKHKEMVQKLEEDRTLYMDRLFMAELGRTELRMRTSREGIDLAEKESEAVLKNMANFEERFSLEETINKQKATGIDDSLKLLETTNQQTSSYNFLKASMLGVVEEQEKLDKAFEDAENRQKRDAKVKQELSNTIQ